MKAYCLYDKVRRKYFRSVHDGRDSFTKNPYQLSTDWQRLAKRMERLNDASEWARTNTGPVPRLVIAEFEFDVSPEPSYARH